MNQEQLYVSGLGKESVVPPDIKRWNWGAFFLNWIWGIGNSTYIAFLMFVPFVNLIMFFVLGAKGSEWAWKNRTWRDVEHFKQTQRKWTIAGLILYFAVIPLIIVSLAGLMKGEAFDQSFAAIESNEEVIELIGVPITQGYFVTGNISTSGPDGKASLQYSVTGSKGSAKAYVLAYKSFGEWQLDRVVVVSEEQNHKIQVVEPIQ